MERRVTGFHRERAAHWVADLECGHSRHVRHRPPFINRPWVLSEQGRQRHIGMRLWCKLCDDE